MNDLEIRLRRFLSRYPRLKRLASAVRRRMLWRGGDAAAHWDAQVGEVESSTPRGWLDVELVERFHIRPQISGDPDVFFLEHFRRHHLAGPALRAPVARMLSLGCGGGNLERALIEIGAATHVEAVDASPSSIELAAQLATGAGLADRLDYRVADIDRIELEPRRYDAVVAKMSLHHFERLEHVFDQVAASLKPGGVLMFNEFVGPTRFQWTDEQLDHMNRLLHALPARIRNRTAMAEIRRPLVADVIAQDPSESIRSSDIMPLVRERFQIVEEKPYGGTLLHILLEQVLPVIDLNDEQDRALVRLVTLYERGLVETGRLPSDFVYVVARPHTESGPQRDRQ